jgi:hypothetical protein
MMEQELNPERTGLKLLRFILLTVIAYFVIRLIKSFFSGAKSGKSVVGQVGAPKRVAETMIRCAACSTYITESSAMRAGNQLFCSNSCAKVGVQRA